MSGVLLADDPAFSARCPEGWGGETIQLPPGFAPAQLLRLEHIRFVPGMM